MFENERGVDLCADMAVQRRIGVGFLEYVEFSVLDVSKSRRKTLADQGEERKDMIARATGIGKMLLDLQNRVVIEQTIEDIDGLAFSRADRQYAEVSILVREMTVGCCHVKFLWPERPGARRYSGETGRNFPCIESFEAMVANCVCGSATRWNRETIAGR